MIHAHDNGGADDNHLPPGDGKIDWEQFLRDLIKVRFRGAFVLEMAGHTDPAVTMANARRGRSYLREISRRLALSHLRSDPSGLALPLTNLASQFLRSQKQGVVIAERGPH
jgi:hypothetical protein